VRPPAGRIEIGDRVALRDGRSGRVVGERLIVSNGAWLYTLTLDDGGTAEALDYELTKLPEEGR
jgi:hypothetical protein